MKNTNQNKQKPAKKSRKATPKSVCKTPGKHTNTIEKLKKKTQNHFKIEVKPVIADTARVKKNNKKSSNDTPCVKNKSKTKPQKAARKQRSDSIQHNVDIAQAALCGVEPPDGSEIPQEAMRFWNSIINEFAIIEWSEHTLDCAVILTRNMFLIEQAQKKIISQGMLLKQKQIIKATKPEEKDKVVVVGHYANPLKQFINMYHGHILSMRRSLSMHARGMKGEQRDIEKQRTQAKAIEQGMKTNDDDLDDLLPTPRILN